MLSESPLLKIATMHKCYFIFLNEKTKELLLIWDFSHKEGII